MNNRPLFWAVMCFALGEVVYIVADRGNKIGTAFVVLVFVVFFLSKTKLSLGKKVIYPMMFLVGVLRIYVADLDYMGDVLYGRGEYVSVIREYDGYTVTYQQGVLDEGEYKKGYQYLARRVNVIGEGIVDNLSLGSSGYNVTIKIKYSQTDKAEILKPYKIIIYGVEQTLSIGDMILLEGEVCDFAPSFNPGEFDRKNFYKARGIVGYSTSNGMNVKKINKGSVGSLCVGIVENIGYKLKDGLYRFRENIDCVLEEICLGESKDLYSGILLGDKTGISDVDMLLYRLAGIAHIFAISGLHIGIVGGLLYKLLRKLGLRFTSAAILAMLVTFLYGIMTGFSFSTIRAMVMLGLSLVGEIIGRRYDMLTGMMVALFGLLIVEPFRILDGGLLLSFGAVAGVVVAKYVVTLLEGNKGFRQLQKKRYRRLYNIIATFIFSLTVTLVTTPLVAYMYYQISMYSVIINMLVVPLMSVVVYSGMFGVLVGMISPFFGRILIMPGMVCLWMYKKLSELLQQLPGNVLNTGKPSPFIIVVYYIMLAVVLVSANPKITAYIRNKLYNKRKKWIPYLKLRRMSLFITTVFVVISVVAIGFASNYDHREKIVFLDVGQGDGIIINTQDGTNIVIDMGSTSSDSLGEYVAYPALLTELMGQVDYWFISHLDKDHISGLEYVLFSEIDMGINIDNIVLGANCGELEEDIIKKAMEKGINIIYMKQGDYISGGGFRIQALHPSDKFSYDDKNEQSLVLAYESQVIKILFTGDIGEEAIMHMLANGILASDYDIVKSPHHGSKYSYSMKFLEKINCEVAVISCGAMNSYGHPHKETLEGYDDAGLDVYRTDYQGRILIIPD